MVKASLVGSIAKDLYGHRTVEHVNHPMRACFCGMPEDFV